MLALLLLLAAAGLCGGAVAGVIAGLRPEDPLRVGTAFLAYLGLLAVSATTWAQSMEALPFVLIAGAGIGILPFGAAFFLLRQAVRVLRSSRPRP